MKIEKRMGLPVAVDQNEKGNAGMEKRLIPMEDLCRYDYALKDISVIEQTWPEGGGYNGYLVNPRREDGICLMAGAEVIYSLKDGRKLIAEPGEVVYLPRGSRYGAAFYQKDSALPSNILINFQIFDQLGSAIILGNSPLVISIFDRKKYWENFSEAKEAFYKGQYMPGRIKGIVYQILTGMSSEVRKRKFPQRKYGNIEKGIRYLEQNWTENTPVSELAAMCGVSEGCFRRLFSQYMNMSPVQYRNHMRISRAKKLLLYDSATVDEVSRALGFEDAAYFSKLFKKKTGCSPSRYGGKEREASGERGASCTAGIFSEIF